MKPISDHITDLYLKWQKDVDKIKKDMKRAKPKQSADYNWGLLWGTQKSMLGLAELKIKAVMIEMIQNSLCPDCGSHMKKKGLHLVCPNPKCRSEI